jgi:hypothetical protein
LPERERRDLVQGVDGHALAVTVLGGVLAERPPTDELERLRTDLAQATTTNARVAKVLGFYANRLSDADRYLVAAIGLFAHPVAPDTVLTVAGHASFGGRLDGWTTRQVEAAAHDRLAGLLSWHPDGSLSAHPLVRETFRPLALGAAEIAADATLTDVPARIASREDGMRVVEAIELLLGADQWEAADDLYRIRTDTGKIWKWLPAARLGQRAASAFVATPARRQACLKQLSPDRLRFYLHAVGLHGMHGGDLVTAREYLEEAVHHYREAGNFAHLSIVLRSLAECLVWLGEIESARRATVEAAIHAAPTGDLLKILKVTAHQGYVAMMAGDSRAAEMHFLAADREFLYTNYRGGEHMHALGGVWWGEFLARTGRPGPARSLTNRNRELSTDLGWNEEVARCDRLLARLDLAAGKSASAGHRLTAATATLRDGDYLVELAETLPVLADCARASGDQEGADRHVEEALGITSPRGLLPSHVAALVVRARTCADRVAAGSRIHLEPGRDAADAAHRIAIRHRLAWHSLDALDAHAYLDQVESTDRGWAQQATTLRARLNPVELDSDPLTTVERQVAET